MKKVLITGATGFIGKACMAALQRKDLEIHCISRQPQLDLPSNGTKWHQFDLHDHSAIKALLSSIRPEYLLHLAWNVEHTLYWSSNENLKWIETSLKLAAEFINSGGIKLVAAGSCAEYNWDSEVCSKPLDEDSSPLNPRSLYGSCKVSLYHSLKAYSKFKGINFAWGRLFSPYGPRENSKRLIPSTILSLLDNKIATCSNPDFKRDFIFIDEVGKIFAELVTGQVTGAINIASGKATSLEEIVTLIANLLKSPDLVECKHDSSDRSDPLMLVANVNKLENTLRYIPQYTLEEGLVKTILWWKQQISLDTLSKSMNIKAL